MIRQKKELNEFEKDEVQQDMRNLLQRIEELESDNESMVNQIEDLDKQIEDLNHQLRKEEQKNEYLLSDLKDIIERS